MVLWLTPDYSARHVCVTSSAKRILRMSEEGGKRILE